MGAMTDLHAEATERVAATRRAHHDIGALDTDDEVCACGYRARYEPDELEPGGIGSRAARFQRHVDEEIAAAVLGPVDDKVVRLTAELSAERIRANHAERDLRACRVELGQHRTR